MKKVIFSIAIVMLLLSCKKSELEIEIDKLERDKAIYDLREAKLQYVKSLIYIKQQELGTPAEKLIDSLVNEENTNLKNDSN